MIKRAMSMGKLRPEGIAEYREAHDTIHKDYVNGIHKAGFLTISCFLSGQDLAVYSETYAEGYEKEREELGRNEEAVKFGKRMAPLVEPGTKSIEFKEIFYMPDLSNGKPIADEKRVVSMSQLKPEKVADYIRHHDEIKPEFLDLFREAGVFNISCFLHETTLLVYFRRDEAIWPGKEAWFESHPLRTSFMELMKPLGNREIAPVELPEVFRLPKIA